MGQKKSTPKEKQSAILSCKKCTKPVSDGRRVCLSCEVSVERVKGIAFSEADFVIDNLFIGPEGAGIDLPYLRKLKVTRVVVAARGLETHFADYGIKYLYLPLDDKDDQDIGQYFEKVIQFIKGAGKDNVLVHCRSGVSRSATLVIAYCMKVRGATVDQAYLYLKRKRPLVSPISGFHRQLKEYEKQLGNLSDEDWDRGPLV